jgi:hypothetical protein
MTAPDAGLGERIAAVLAEHRAIPHNSGYDRCTCGERTLIGAEHRAHVAAALAPLVAEEVAAAEVRALREAARDALASPSTRLGDVHPGEVWAAWLDSRADRIAEGVQSDG